MSERVHDWVRISDLYAMPEGCPGSTLPYRKTLPPEWRRLLSKGQGIYLIADVGSSAKLKGLVKAPQIIYTGLVGKVSKKVGTDGNFIPFDSTFHARISKHLLKASGCVDGVQPGLFQGIGDTKKWKKYRHEVREALGRAYQGAPGSSFYDPRVVDRFALRIIELDGQGGVATRRIEHFEQLTWFYCDQLRKKSLELPRCNSAGLSKPLMRGLIEGPLCLIGNAGSTPLDDVMEQGDVSEDVGIARKAAEGEIASWWRDRCKALVDLIETGKMGHANFRGDKVLALSIGGVKYADLDPKRDEVRIHTRLTVADLRGVNAPTIPIEIAKRRTAAFQTMLTVAWGDVSTVVQAIHRKAAKDRP